MASLWDWKAVPAIAEDEKPLQLDPSWTKTRAMMDALNKKYANNADVWNGGLTDQQWATVGSIYGRAEKLNPPKTDDQALEYYLRALNYVQPGIDASKGGVYAVNKEYTPYFDSWNDRINAQQSVGEWLTSGFGLSQADNPRDIFDTVYRAAWNAGKPITYGQIASMIRSTPSDGWTWWGQEARKDNLIKSLGIDSTPYLNMDAYKAQQQTAADRGMASQAGGGGGDEFFMAGLPAAALMVVGLGFAGALGAGAAAGATAAEGTAAGLSAADVFTGGVINSAGEVAGLSTLGNTGGALVGTGGLISGTGNAVVDAALNKGLQGVITSAVTGQDPLKGGIAGALTGGFASVLPDLGSPILNNAATGAISGGIGAAVNGGDPLTGALAGGAAAGAGTAVKAVLPSSEVGSAVSNAAAGAVAGGVGSAIAGGDVAAGIIKGATSGGVTGLATDLGASPAVAGAAGSVAAGLIDSPTLGAGTPAAQQQTTSNTITGGLGFEIALPQFQNLSRRDMQWGTRLNGGPQ